MHGATVKKKLPMSEDTGPEDLFTEASCYMRGLRPLKFLCISKICIRQETTLQYKISSHVMS